MKVVILCGGFGTRTIRRILITREPPAPDNLVGALQILFHKLVHNLISLIERSSGLATPLGASRSERA